MARTARTTRGVGEVAREACSGKRHGRRRTPRTWLSPRAPRCGLVLPVDLEREGAALGARQRGHGARAARRPRDSRGCGRTGLERTAAAAAPVAPAASLICQPRRETSVFPPWRRSSRGRALHRRPQRRPAWHAPSARRGRGRRAELRSGCSESPAAGARFPPLARSGEGRRRASRDRERWPETPPAAGAGGQLGQLGQRAPGPAAWGSGGVSWRVDAIPGRRQFENNNNNNKTAISWDTSQLFQPNAHYHSWNTLL